MKVHRATVIRQWEKTGGVSGGDAGTDGSKLDLLTMVPDFDDERSEWTPEELEAEETAQIEAATAMTEADSPRDAGAEALWHREQALLDQMEDIADRNRHVPDSKTRWLIDWIRENLCPDLPSFGKRPEGLPKWNNRRVIIFTENREGTKRYLKMIFEQAIEWTDRAADRIEVIDGLTSRARRKEIQRRFNTEPAKDPLRILLATDAAR